MEPQNREIHENPDPALRKPRCIEDGGWRPDKVLDTINFIHPVRPPYPILEPSVTPKKAGLHDTRNKRNDRLESTYCGRSRENWLQTRHRSMDPLQESVHVARVVLDIRKHIAMARWIQPHRWTSGSKATTLHTFESKVCGFHMGIKQQHPQMEFQ